MKCVDEKNEPKKKRRIKSSKYLTCTERGAKRQRLIKYKRIESGSKSLKCISPEGLKGLAPEYQDGGVQFFFSKCKY